MNKTNFRQTGGFPVKAERLQELQTAYSIFNHLGNLAGNFAIVSGCAVVGTNVSDGFVVINDELLEFKGGSVADDVIIIETASSKEFKNGEVKEVHFERFATFGTSVESFPWADFKRPIQTKEIPLDLVTRLEKLEKKSAVFQAGGGMVLWNKPALDIPEGWAEVANWKGRIPVGLDATQTEFNLMGKQGGSKDAVLVSHSHTISNSGNVNNGASGGSVSGKTARWDSGSGAFLNGTISTEGVSGAGKNLQPYRVVMFIEFIG